MRRVSSFLYLYTVLKLRLEKMRREREVWAAVNHSNIVPLYGYAEDEEKFGLFGALISPVSKLKYP